MEKERFTFAFGNLLQNGVVDVTPFGLHLRRLREDRGITQKDMAEALGVSAAYLSALEHGKRGTPSYVFLQRVVGYFNVIWDDAEEMQRLANLSDPKVSVNTENLSATATEAANLLSQNITKLSDERLNEIIELIEKAD